MVGEAFLERVVEVGDVGDASAEGAAQLRVRSEVGVVEAHLPFVPAAGALFLGDLAEHRVVQQDVGDRHRVFDRGGQLGEVLAESLGIPPAVAEEIGCV